MCNECFAPFPPAPFPPQVGERGTYFVGFWGGGFAAAPKPLYFSPPSPRRLAAWGGGKGEGQWSYYRINVLIFEQPSQESTYASNVTVPSSTPERSSL